MNDRRKISADAKPRPSSHRSSAIERRTFLRYVGAASGLALGWLPASCTPSSSRSPVGADTDSGESLGSVAFHSPPYPVPLPGDSRPRASFERFEVIDDLVLPAGFSWKRVATWGEVYGAPGAQIRFGNNCDYTGLLPVSGRPGEYWLFVNHEYVSPRPWLDAWPEIYASPVPRPRLEADTERPRGVAVLDGWRSSSHTFSLDGGDAGIPEQARLAVRCLARAILGEMGVSVLHVRRRADQHFEVIRDSSRHRRISTASSENVSPQHSPRFTGPLVKRLGSRAPGTMCNCSGGTTPWGTFLTCEENIQNQVTEEVGPVGELLQDERRLVFTAELVGGERVFDHPTPAAIDGSGLVAFEEPLDGRHYGWVGEIDPTTGALKKHTALGRFRHENVALRVEAGRPLAAYMGDDRRGGHLWKFVSDAPVSRPDDLTNSELLHSGTLFVARFEEQFRGRWLALQPETPLVRPTPESTADGFLRLPRRPEGGTVKVAVDPRGDDELSVDDWCRSIEAWSGSAFEDCTLRDLVAPELRPDSAAALQVLLLDAFCMANAAGGTPTARPEDVEVHPADASLFIAFTDATGGSDGSPAVAVFPDSRRENSRQYGVLVRLVEGDGQAGSSPSAKTFRWGHFLNSGETADHGGGFACADNLAFDPEANLWMVTDISTTAQNFPVRSDDERVQVGAPLYCGVFGNNSLFRIPTSGKDSGVPQLFGIGPVDSELTGPTFTPDGRILLLSVQHPGESGGTRLSSNPSLEIVTHIHDIGGEIIAQRRTVPIGSNFPSGELNRAPRSCVVSISRDRTGNT